MRNVCKALLSVAFFLLPLAASAHLAGGSDPIKDGFVLDFGYDPAPPVAGALTTLAFNLADSKTGTAVSPESVWVRISKSSTVIFAGTLHPADKNVTFQTVLPDAGDYTVTARYAYRGRELDETYLLTAAAPPLAETLASGGPPEAAPPKSTTRADAETALALIAVALCAYTWGRARGKAA